MRSPSLLLPLLLVACAGPQRPHVALAPNGPLDWPRFERLQPLDLPIIEDHPIADSLLIQVTFALPDSSFLMVAGPQDEARTDGLRLYRYLLVDDSTARFLSYSAPGYDSQTMLPTCFGDPSARSGPWLVLANFGEKDSWGQKVMVLDDGGFHDLGFLDVAVPERRPQVDTVFLRLGNIAPHVVARSIGDTLRLDLTCDSVHLYDDLQGHRDTMRAGSSTGYVIVRGGAFLLRDGNRLVPVPAPV